MFYIDQSLYERKICFSVVRSVEMENEIRRLKIEKLRREAANASAEERLLRLQTNYYQREEDKAMEAEENV